MKKSKRIIAFNLAILLMFTILPLQIFAVGTSNELTVGRSIEFTGSNDNSPEFTFNPASSGLYTFTLTAKEDYCYANIEMQKKSGNYMYGLRLERSDKARIRTEALSAGTEYIVSIYNPNDVYYTLSVVATKCQSLAIGGSVSYSSTGNDLWFSFVPPSSGWYVATSSKMANRISFLREGDEYFTESYCEGYTSFSYLTKGNKYYICLDTVATGNGTLSVSATDSVVFNEEEPFISENDYLTSATLGENVVSLMRDYSFFGCKNLENISVDSGNKKFSSVDGVLFNKNKTELICYPPAKSGSSYTVPNTVADIQYKAFNSSKNLLNVTVPASVKSIGEHAFSGSANQSIYFEGNAPTVLSADLLARSFDTSDTLYYVEGKSGWTDSSAYDSKAGTWNGYKLKPSGESTQKELKLSSCYPPKGATNVKKNDSLVLEFSEELSKNPNWLNGGIHIIDRKTEKEVLNIDDKVFYSLNGQINGNKVTIPNAFLKLPQSTYKVIIDADVFMSATTYGKYYKGISGDYCFSIHKKAIIVIPGITGSELFKGKDKLWAQDDLSLVSSTIGVIDALLYDLKCDEYGNSKPGIFTLDESQSPYGTYFDGYYYKDIVDSLKRFSGEYDVRFFSYDWRLTNTSAAEQLNAFISDAGYDETVLVAHSMGGIVASLYMAEYGTDKVDKLITIGTPYYGAPKAIYTFETGRFLDGAVGALSAPLIKGIAPNVAGIYELIPNQRYYGNKQTFVSYKKDKLGYNAAKALFESRDWYNEYLFEQFEDVFSKKYSYSSVYGIYDEIISGKIDSYIIVGYNRDTLSGVQYDSDRKVEDVTCTSGDGTVPLISSTFNYASTARKLYYVNGVTHSDLPKNGKVIELVCDIIKGNGDSKYTATANGLGEKNGIYRSVSGLKQDQLSWKITAACPVSVSVYDNGGNLVGTISSDGMEVSEEYESNFYLAGAENEKKIIFLDSDDYDVIISGNDTGTMDLKIEKVRGDETQSFVSYEDVPITASTKIFTDVKISENSKLEIDADGDGKTKMTLDPTEKKIQFTPSEKKYSLSFETNGGEKLSQHSFKFDTVVDLTKYIPTRDGHTFKGWYLDSKLSLPVSSVKMVQDTTVYAKWEKNVDTNRFSDVSINDWFYLDVEYAFENGLMQGTAEDKFSPYVNTSRGMIVTILWRLEGSPDVTGRCQFADVKPGSYYEKAVIWATENGIVKGYSTTKFGPDDDINREQLATLIYRYAEYKGYDVSARTNLSAYSDLSKISSFATEQMSWANAVGLINGTTPTTLNPGGLAQRCQAAAVFHRFLTGFAK